MLKYPYIRITDTEELFKRLETEGGRILAGGTDLMLKIKHGMARPKAVYDISGIERLCHITEDKGGLYIGAAVKLRDIVNDPKIKEHAPLLSKFAEEIGSMEVRSMGTIGGNLCASRANCGVCFLPGCRAMTADRTVLPCRNSAYADLLLPLVAYGASVKIESASSSRTVSVKDFFAGSGKIDLKPQELLSEVIVPKESKEAKFGVAELRQPVKMGFPYISVIAEAKAENFNITVGGSTDKIYTFENVKSGEEGCTCAGAGFLEALRLSKEYRKEVLASVIREAIEKCGQETLK